MVRVSADLIGLCGADQNPNPWLWSAQAMVNAGDVIPRAWLGHAWLGHVGGRARAWLGQS